eukprot:11025095-Alexandrium_andersonii.AAC.1
MPAVQRPTEHRQVVRRQRRGRQAATRNDALYGRGRVQPLGFRCPGLSGSGRRGAVAGDIGMSGGLGWS